MKNGEIYNLLLRYLNQGKTRINTERIEDEITGEESDAQAVLSFLRSSSMARKINDKDYELICTVRELRDLVLGLETDISSGDTEASYCKEADAPISFSDLVKGEWTLAEEKAPTRHARRDGAEEAEEEESDEKKKERQERVKSIFKEISGYNGDAHAIPPYFAQARLPDGYDQPILRWGVDKDNDCYITDNGAAYNYFLSVLNRHGVEYSAEHAKAIVRYSILWDDDLLSADKEVRALSIENAEGKDHVYRYVSVYCAGYGRLLMNSKDIVSLLTDNEEAEVEKKLNSFVKETNPTSLDGVSVAHFIGRLLSIDPRITIDQARATLKRLMEHWGGDVGGKSRSLVRRALDSLANVNMTDFVARKIASYMTKNR